MCLLRSLSFFFTSIFASHLHGIPGDLLSHIQSTSETFTFFAPNNDAFAKVPRTIQQRMAQVDQLRSEVSDVLGLHFTSQLVSVCERYKIPRFFLKKSDSCFLFTNFKDNYLNTSIVNTQSMCRRYMAEILPIRHKSLSNQSINQSMCS